MQNSIGERIVLIRQQFEINQGQLSEEIGMNQGLVSKFEKNKREPSKGFLNAMMLRFGANPEWIMTGEGEMFITAEEYIARGMQLLGPASMSRGFANVLKDSRFTEFQSFLDTDKFNPERGDDELGEFLQQAAQVWRQGDGRIRKALSRFVKGYLEKDE